MDVPSICQIFSPTPINMTISVPVGQTPEDPANFLFIAATCRRKIFLENVRLETAPLSFPFRWHLRFSFLYTFQLPLPVDLSFMHVKTKSLEWHSPEITLECWLECLLLLLGIVKIIEHRCSCRWNTRVSITRVFG